MADTVQEPLHAPLFQFVHGLQSFAHLFYQDISRLGCSNDNGEMSIATAMEAIKEKILSKNYDHLRARILSVDAQESCNDAVKVHVNGCVVGTDELARNFQQTFFLAPKEGGYSVMNDMFRFVEQEEVPPAEVIKEIPNIRTMVPAEEVPLVKVPKVETMVDVEEVPLIEVVDRSCVVEADETPIAKVIHEVRDNSCVVKGKAVSLVDAIGKDIGVVKGKDVSLVNAVSTDIGAVKGNDVSLVDAVSTGIAVVKGKNVSLVNAVSTNIGVIKGKDVSLVDAVSTDIGGACVPSSSVVRCCVDPKEVPLGNDVGETSDPFRMDDTGECVTDKVHDDSREVEPNEVSRAKVIYEVPDLSCMVKSKSNIQAAPKKSEFNIEAAPKKSHVSNENGATSSSYTPAIRIIVPTIQQHQVRDLQPSIVGGEFLQPISIEGADDYSIYIKCLPMSATPSLLEEEFKRFGAIKSGGIQVKKNKQGFCFGFVEFEEANSLQNALKASPIFINGQQIAVQAKCPSNYRGGRGAHRFRHDGIGVGENRHDFSTGGRGRARWE